METSVSDFAKVDVVCPECGRKACFKSSWNSGYIRRPQNEGVLTCIHCGLVKSYKLDNLKYYYAIEVGGRHLVGRTKDDFITLYNYFRENKRWEEDPDLDFPKVFYINRKELIKKARKLLDQEV